MISGLSPEDNQERRGRLWVDMGSLARIAVADTVSVGVDNTDANSNENNDLGE